MRSYQVRKVDCNQAEMVSDLRKLGFAVECVHTLGLGRPDLIVSNQVYMFWVEVKDKSQELTDKEKSWWAKWRGVQPVLARCTEDVLEAFKLHENSNK